MLGVSIPYFRRAAIMKRALIVDDSRSARVILGRMLESYGLEADACESAEQALEHLRHSRADVVFMDHLMPGMDGFQAVQAIKSNPETAMIPVVMYTSQEGELYLSQARALGAVGVLPKTINQADVSRVLYQLHLLPERRCPTPQVDIRSGTPPAQLTPLSIAGTASPGDTSSQPAPATAKSTVVPQAHSAAVGSPHQVIQLDAHGVPGEMEIAIRTAVAPLLKEHGLEMRRLILASLEAFSRRISKETKEALGHAQPAPETPETATPAALPPPGARRWHLAAALAALALLPTMVLALLHLNTLDQTRTLAQSNSELAGIVAAQQADLQELQKALDSRLPDTAGVALMEPQTIATASVPYGETPLAGERLEQLREMVVALKADGFRGKVRIATFTGEFCLTGNGIEGYSVATDDTPLKRCDLVGNPFEDSLTAAQRQSLAFANLVASIRQESAATLTVEVQHEGRRPSVPYPDGSAMRQLSAGEWNRIATQNNRVEFAALPAGS